MLSTIAISAVPASSMSCRPSSPNHALVLGKIFCSVANHFASACCSRGRTRNCSWLAVCDRLKISIISVAICRSSSEPRTMRLPALPLEAVRPFGRNDLRAASTAGTIAGSISKTFISLVPSIGTTSIAAKLALIRF